MAVGEANEGRGLFGGGSGGEFQTMIKEIFAG
jgi:hypothetical protein